MRKDHLKVYKGRVVVQGDMDKDEDGFYAVSSEQGSSESELEAARATDAFSQAPGCAGEVSDDVKAYAQLPLALMAKLVGEVYAETLINLPWQMPKRVG